MFRRVLGRGGRGLTVILAMWSGPRNISTAMMRSWDARGDTRVVDEPLYAHYLSATRLDHPGAEEVIAHGETDLDTVVAQLSSPQPGDPAIVYQKHMAHHVLPGMDLSWTARVRNAMLIREPREMLTSLLAVLPNADLQATGLPAQIGLLERLGSVPVIDSRDVLDNPAGMLRALCDAVGVRYTDRMLSWKPGPRQTDGVWAKHWYASVNASTGFAPYRPKQTQIAPRHTPLLRQCEALYDRLREHKVACAASLASEEGGRAAEG